MGDIANMTDCGGRVNGFRLLSWLRSREKLADQRALGMLSKSRWESEAYQLGVRDVLREMADDLEAEINPPDYPEDDDDDDDRDDKDAGPCEYCGKMADRVPVHENGRVFLGCPACRALVDDDTVDLDDPALRGGPEDPADPAHLGGI